MKSDYGEGLELIVIGEANGLRNRDLKKEVGGFPIKYVPPVYLNKGDEPHKWKAMITNKLVFGRSLLPGEIGCGIAHRQARARISGDIALILEDDAIISAAQIANAFRIIKETRLEDPFVVSLMEQKPKTFKEPELRRVSYMPGKTTAYFASKSTADFDVKIGFDVGTADWPMSFVDVNFYVLKGLGVGEVGGDNSLLSTIDKSGNRNTNSTLYYARAFLFLFPLTFLWGAKLVRFSLLKPLIRDFSNRFSPSSG